MNICLVHEEYPEETNFGGIATYQKISAEEYVKQNNNVIVICRGLKKDLEYIENGVKIYRIYVDSYNKTKLEAYTEYRERVAKLLLKLQNENKIDIIEVPDWGAETVLFEKYRKVPLVVRLHTPLKVWLKYNKSNFGDVTAQMLAWEEEMLYNADFVTCCSEALKEIIIQDFNIKEDKILVTPNPANICNFYRNENLQKENTIVFVGSLEERKGVLVLASALNLVLTKYPNFNVQFIGKNTTRNNKDISTIDYITEIVDKKYHNNLTFKGQLENFEINDYLNKAKIGVFPSLFDNFPYTVLEAMATGLQIVGSQNSGMREMLKDSSSLYESGNYQDLADKIMGKIKLLEKEVINVKNIETVQNEYNASNVCKNMIELYSNTIRKYELTKVIQTLFPNETIEEFIRESGGVANKVFNVKTSSNKSYIIKKYTRTINFDLSNKLYNLYETYGIDVIKPLNKDLICYKDNYYNIFDYIKNDKNKVINYNFILNLLLCDRKVNLKENLIKKYNSYYNHLKFVHTIDKKIPYEDLKFVLDIYKSIRKKKLFKESFLNHGDISLGNLLTTDSITYLIDFDETLVSTMLYDFAVVIIKLFVEENKIKLTEYNYFKDEIKKKYNYSDEDFEFSINLYLTKILLEKFYLHHTHQIDLFSKRQLTDNFEKYLDILKNFTRGEFYENNSNHRS